MVGNSEEQSLVYIIILNYNNEYETYQCLRSLKNINYLNYKILIVDNASTDDSVNKIKMYESVECIFSTINLGYAGGNNIGIKYAYENGAKYVCLMNNDVEVTADFLNILVNRMEENSKLAMVGPAICEYYQPEIIQSAGCRVNYYTGGITVMGANQCLKTYQHRFYQCDALGGACILVRMSALRQIGLIPERYFLYFEETEWCKKATNEGYLVKCDSLARVYHKGSISVNKIADLQVYFINRNRVVFIKNTVNTCGYIFFLITHIVRQCYRILFRKDSILILYATFDGMKNSLSKKFKNCYVNNQIEYMEGEN